MEGFIQLKSLYKILALFLCFSHFHILIPDYAHASSSTLNPSNVLKRLILVNETDHHSVKNLKNRGTTQIQFNGLKNLAVLAKTSTSRNIVIEFTLSNRKGIKITSTITHPPYLFKKLTSSGLSAGTYWLTAIPYIRTSLRTYIKIGPGLSQKLTLSSALGSSLTSLGRSSSQVRIPSLSVWESNMLSFGRMHCQNLLDPSISFDSHLAATYYDAEWVYYQIADYTGDNSWLECAHAAQSIYRDLYVMPNNGVVPGYWNFSHGMARDLLSTGDQISKSGVLQLSQNASYAPDGTPLSWTENANMSREVAYAIMAYLNAEAVGAKHRSRTEQLITQALGHLDQWTVSHTADYVRPFMFSLTAHALISYDEQVGGNPKIFPSLKIAADWIWDNLWNSDAKAFKYTDHAVSSGGTEAAPDLNLLIAPVYAWLWHQTGNSVYRDRSDQIFEGGVAGAWLANGKQFNQNYRWSFDFIKWRSMSPLK